MLVSLQGGPKPRGLVPLSAWDRRSGGLGRSVGDSKQPLGWELVPCLSTPQSQLGAKGDGIFEKMRISETP